MIDKWVYIIQFYNSIILIISTVPCRLFLYIINKYNGVIEMNGVPWPMDFIEGIPEV